jgi:putative tryptophan/tyrosine transport system substrate-binding protein
LAVEIRRRDFIALLGVAASGWPLALRAQKEMMPRIGLLGSSTAPESTLVTGALREGLNESGFIEGQNLSIDYRWARGNYDRLPALAADLVGERVALIVTTGAEPSALAAKSATNKIPIVFVITGNPVSIGLVDSLNRPGGNATGMSLIASELDAKRLEILGELVPKNTLIAVLVNPDYPDTDFQVGGLETAAGIAGQKITMLNARSEADLDKAFASMIQQRVGALLVAADPLFNRLHDQVVALAMRYKVPAIYESREFVAAGGVISYGASIAAAYLGAGAYAGRILKGAKPIDLPVQLPTTFELVLNLKAAKAIGLAIPPTLIARADEVIE